LEVHHAVARKQVESVPRLVIELNSLAGHLSRSQPSLCQFSALVLKFAVPRRANATQKPSREQDSDPLSQIDSSYYFEIQNAAHFSPHGRCHWTSGRHATRSKSDHLSVVATYKLAVCVLFHRRHFRHHMVGLLDCEVECEKCRGIWMVN
jgi:hypothetical protein